MVHLPQRPEAAQQGQVVRWHVVRVERTTMVEYSLDQGLALIPWQENQSLECHEGRYRSERRVRQFPYDMLDLLPVCLDPDHWKMTTELPPDSRHG